MQQIFQKDDCALDAKTAKQFLSELWGRKFFDVDLEVGSIRIKSSTGDDDYILITYKGVNYVIEYSCGIYETVYTVDTQSLIIWFSQLIESVLQVKNFRGYTYE